MINEAPAIPPTSVEASSPPKEKRRSLATLARFFNQQYEDGCVYRQRRHLNFIAITSYLRGIHFFDVSAFGHWTPIPPEKGKHRIPVAVIAPTYRHVLGIFNANDTGVHASPVSTGAQGFHQAERAEAAIQGWMEENNFASIFDRANQMLLAEGTVGFLRELDFFAKTVRVRPIPGSRIFPIPFDAVDPAECHGFMIVSVVSKSWLELQDDIYTATTGKAPELPLATLSGKMLTGMNLRMPYYTGPAGGEIDAAVIKSVYMDPSPQVKTGEWFLLVNDQIVRYIGENYGKPEQMFGLSLPGEPVRTPLEIAYFDKHPHEFLGQGLCEMQLASQRARDYMRSIQFRRLANQRTTTFYHSDAVSATHLQDQDNAFVPFTGSKLEDRNTRPVYSIPADQMDRDSVIFDSIVAGDGDRAVGLRSGIVWGQQEGRTESGPATSLLSHNAMASLQPALTRMTHALTRTYEGVLDMLPQVWTTKKHIRVMGPSNVGREIVFNETNRLPRSQDVVLRSSPLLPGGANAQLALLFQLRQIPGADGVQGSEVSSREFRAALSRLNRLPRGIEFGDRASARIQDRINALIGDTQKPYIQSSDPANPRDRLIFEEHKTSVDMLVNAILDDSFTRYSPVVQAGLMRQLQFHRDQLYNAGVMQPNGFDDDVEKLLSRQVEQAMSAAEADIFTPEGTFSLE